MYTVYALDYRVNISSYSEYYEEHWKSTQVNQNSFYSVFNSDFFLHYVELPIETKTSA